MSERPWKVETTTGRTMRLTQEEAELLFYALRKRKPFEKICGRYYVLHHIECVERDDD